MFTMHIKSIIEPLSPKINFSTPSADRLVGEGGEESTVAYPTVDGWNPAPVDG